MYQDNSNPVVDVTAASSPSSPTQSSFNPSDWVSALIYAGVQAVNMIANKRSQKRQNAYNAQAAELEYQRNIAQWERENEYNSPTAQMARLAAAGVNPVLAYGGSASSQAAASPSYTSPQADYSNVTLSSLTDQLPNIFGVIAQYQQLQLTQQDIELKKLKVDEERANSPFYSLLAELRKNLASSKATSAASQALFDYNTTDDRVASYQDLVKRIKALSQIAQNQAEVSDELKKYDKEGVKNDLRLKVLALKIARGEATPEEFREYFGHTILSNLPSILSGAASGLGTLGSKLLDYKLNSNLMTDYYDETFLDPFDKHHIIKHKSKKK